MTDLDYSPSSLADYEAEFDALAIPADVADQLFRTAATAYSFTDEPVTDEQLRAVYDLVKWGPTAMNSQPLRVVLVQSPEARERLVPLMSGGNQARVAAAPLTAILAADVDFHDELPRVFPVYPNARDMFADEAARTQSATFNAALQIGYFILGLRAAGLAAGPMGGFDADKVATEFLPDGRHKPLLVVNIGHPAPESYRPRQARLDYEDAVSAV